MPFRYMGRGEDCSWRLGGCCVTLEQGGADPVPNQKIKEVEVENVTR